ncbi:MAG: phosphoenolpyruvate-protein phosphotransferase system enzyme, partial [Cryptosporangiaceae bacterium]|nr:phosphoenolpyruvate-protein phosphotransferase system enzyme [Cryptosporangiaceae bacterium]
MRELTGIGVGYGTAAGPVARMGDPLPEPAADPSRISPEDELASARSAMSGVATELRRRAALAEGPAQEVLEAQALMAEDPGLAPGIESRISAGATAARAVYEAFGEYRTMLAAAGEYLAARVADLDDVRQRVVAGCLGVPVPGVPDPGVPFVL